MKGYKATHNMKCNKLTYEVGKTYTIDNMLMCSHGFHFCEKQKDVLDYYRCTEDFILLEVEALGVVETDGNKTLTDKLKIIRVVPIGEYEFVCNDKKLGFPEETYAEEIRNESNQLTYGKGISGDEVWYEYDANGNQIYRRLVITSLIRREYKRWSYYDDRGNNIHVKTNDGYECWSNFDDNNNEIHYKNNYGREIFSEYDDKNNLISYQDNNPHISWKITITE